MLNFWKCSCWIYFKSRPKANQMRLNMMLRAVKWFHSIFISNIQIEIEGEKCRHTTITITFMTILQAYSISILLLWILLFEIFEKKNSSRFFCVYLSTTSIVCKYGNCAFLSPTYDLIQWAFVWRTESDLESFFLYNYCDNACAYTVWMDDGCCIRLWYSI